MACGENVTLQGKWGLDLISPLGESLFEKIDDIQWLQRISHTISSMSHLNISSDILLCFPAFSVHTSMHNDVTLTSEGSLYFLGVGSTLLCRHQF